MRNPINISILFVIVLLAGVLPAAAEYHQGDIAHGQCFHIEVNSGMSGQYAFFFFSEGQNYQTTHITATTPDTTLEFNVIVTPNTEVQVYTPVGFAFAYVLGSGEYHYDKLGKASIRIAPVDVVCLSANPDGRLNRFDKAMLAVIYPDGHDGFDIWKIDPATSGGAFDYNVSRAQVNAGLAAAEAAKQSQAVASGATSTFYTTPDHQCVVISPNAGGEPQRFDWDCGT